MQGLFKNIVKKLALGVVELYKIEKQLKFEDFVFPYGKLNENNRCGTNIFNKNMEHDKFKELYFLRWGIEGKYKELKSSIQIEEFSGTKPICIEQDFYVSIYLSMIVALIKEEADAAIADEIKDKNLKSTYQSNRNFILEKVFDKIIDLLIRVKSRIKILKNILEKSIKIRSQIRPNRSCERKNKHPRKKHYHNRKSCI